MLVNCTDIRAIIIESKLRVLKTLSFFILLLSAGIAFAAGSDDQKIPQNLHVRSLAASCAACHGTNGNSASANTASIAGTDKANFVSSMQAFKSGARPATVMHRHAKGLTDQEIEDLAEIFSKQPRQSVRAIPSQQLSKDFAN